ncbi:hypothetical protein QFC22_000820 [Naganishia vaughanmartiniae]|uniref:Uncharacterized protein n=1 Tax=Naganishia vaughanmartiniae TaxID=1424756 RepID=A0ACC2XJ86_9TREE|nr:hypothetical protein QFC22_000820 [Naganishia vaughanmartiniae]
MVRISVCTRLLVAIAVCFAFVASAGANPTSDISLYDKRSHLEKRLTVGTVCATVPVSVVGNALNPIIVLDAGVCLCIEAGVLTPASLLALTTSVSVSVNLVLATLIYLTTGGVIDAAIGATETRVRTPAVLNVSRTLANASNALSSLSQLNNIPPTCTYPANSDPACSTYPGAIQQTGTSCYFTCDATFKNCGQFCIPLLQNCISGIPSRRDLKTTTASSNLCPSGLTACYLNNFASLAKGNSVFWECMDTQADIEACGGCQSPVTDQHTGEDCTLMVGVDSVACIDGACEALSCARGYKLDDKECILDATYKSFWLQNI